MARERVTSRREREDITPAFRAFVREVETAIGSKARRVTARDIPMWAIAAPTLETAGRWAKRARAVGGAATLYYVRGKPELRIVAGKVARLTALFSAKLYDPGKLTQAVDSLDDASGVSFDFITDYDGFELQLARACVRPDVFAKVFGEVFRGSRGIRTALSKRRWFFPAERPDDWASD